MSSQLRPTRDYYCRIVRPNYTASRLPIRWRHRAILNSIRMVNDIKSSGVPSKGNTTVRDARRRPRAGMSAPCIASVRLIRTVAGVVGQRWQKSLAVCMKRGHLRRSKALWFMDAYRTAEKIAPFYNHKSVRTSFRKCTQLWAKFFLAWM